MAILRGHAVPTLGGLADHTYVTCQGGYAWPCWGRSAGGRIICSGSGSSSKANCISAPWSTAGLIYGITGVCHQTANRILWPAGVTVRSAKGYWASWLAYGTYGTDTAAWLGRLAVCSLSTGEIAQCAVTKITPKKAMLPAIDREDRALVREIKALYQKRVTPAEHKRRLMAKGPDVKMLGMEVKLAMKQRLGGKSKANLIKEVQEIQQELFAKRAKIEASLHDGSLRGEAFAKKMNDAINKSLRDCQKSLGNEDYSMLMDLKARERIMIVDPKIAAKVHK